MNVTDLVVGLREYAAENPLIAASATAGVLIISAVALSRLLTTDPRLRDKEAAKRFLEELRQVKVVDNGYNFVAAKGQYVDPSDGRTAQISYQRAYAKARENGLTYHQDENAIVMLGKSAYLDPSLDSKYKTSLQNRKAGQCDHMAAAVIAKALQDPNWKSGLELVGNGGHAFVIAGRKPGSELRDPRTWGPNAMIIDAWLNNLGVAKSYEGRLFGGLVTRTEEMIQQLNAFGAERVKVHHTFTEKDVQRLHHMASK